MQTELLHMQICVLSIVLHRRHRAIGLPEVASQDIKERLNGSGPN